MGLLAPLFLLGAVAIALPIWLHRLQTQSSARQPFGSAMLLESSQERVHLQRKLKYLTLLALRVALLLLVVLAFSKPYLSRPPSLLAAGSAGTHLIVVDTSLSMNRAGTFDQAITLANQLIDNAPDGAVLQVLHADDALHIDSQPSANRSDLRAAVSGLEVTALRLEFGSAIAAVDRLAEPLPQPVTVHLISDFQESAMPVRFADVVPSQVTSMVPHVVGTGAPFNWSVDSLRETSSGVDVGLVGFGDAERVADVELFLNGESVDTRGLSETGSFTVQFSDLEYAEGDNRLEVRINTDDDLAADNAWFHIVDNRAPAAVPLITSDRDGLPRTYLSAALEADAGQRYDVEPFVIGEFDARILARHPWVLVDDIGSLDEETENALNDYLEEGGKVLAFAGVRAAGASVLPVSGHRLTAGGSGTDRFLSPGQLDTGHPVLSGTEGWHSVRVSRPIPVEVQAADRVLIRLENNDPFLLERKLGDGLLLLLLNGLDNRWNDLPVRPVFVSFIVEAAAYLSGVSEISRVYTTGATLPLSLVGGASGQVLDPDGNTVLSLVDTTRAQRIKLDKPGIYEVYTAEGSMAVAANIDPRESRLGKVSAELLERWQDAAARPVEYAADESEFAEPEPLEVWHWLLLILAMVIIAESILGNAYLAPREKAGQ